jgi:hypothetical protein
MYISKEEVVGMLELFIQQNEIKQGEYVHEVVLMFLEEKHRRYSSILDEIRKESNDKLYVIKPAS